MALVLQKHLYVILGWGFVLLGLSGVVLPIVPTTPFMILALACFARSSPRFHQMLLNNRWVGPELKRWEETHSMSRKTKRKATLVIVGTFSLSLLLLYGQPALQVLLIIIALILLYFLWRLKEA